MIPKGQVIDCHAHICPDQLAAKNKEIIVKSSGIVPAYDGSVGNLEKMMEGAGITMCIVNNVALNPEIMGKANDFTAKAVSKSGGKFVGMGWIIPGDPKSTEEIERCRYELGFKALKIHNSHFKVLPADRRNDRIYEKIAETGLPVLFHCGANPYAGSSSTQYSMPSNFLQVLKSYPKMKVIFGHAAGYQDDPEKAVELLSITDSVVADTALDIDTNSRSTNGDGSSVGLRSLLERVETSKLVFVSDYPIHDGAKVLSWLKHELSSEEFEIVCSSNTKHFIPL
jgi:uncharacterized protein